MMHLAFPYHADRRGRTAETDKYHAYVAALVEQTLLTAPGERVNRPEFGAGLLEMVFEPGSDTLSDAAEFLVRASLQRWLQEIVLIETLAVAVEDNSLIIALTYQVIETGTRQNQTVTRLL